ncbi:MAG: hypothetical protein F2911_02295 [Actinobacteria bacterium]|uniref:Unannotated protein n=1 Tax=freshwater metagenome TaxID=449393 RepID=A0A6J7BUU3_9ZZZZ|nr:hypothetical protein [Actinomycetota bacterium]MSW37757.1 hypothetical protein [Actinomycetota bacterium]MSX38200.1 hypothetical protein [Actinomycetota bacterium]
MSPSLADEPVTTGVGLVFSDGSTVELRADDPRVTAFQAAAAALLGATGEGRYCRTGE